MSEFFKKINLMTEPYLIAEIGINHNGNMDIAKKLIDATNACRWHCAKFQKGILMFVFQTIKKELNEILPGAR